MNYKDLIKSTEKAFLSLINLLEKPVKFYETDDDGSEVPVEPYKFKSVVDGRNQVFSDAVFHIERLRTLEDSDGDKGMEKNYRGRLQMLVDAVEKTIGQVQKIQEMPIDADEEDDDKVKMISQSKSLALVFLENVMQASEDAKSRLSSDKPLATSEKLNFAKERAKMRNK